MKWKQWASAGVVVCALAAGIVPLLAQRGPRNDDRAAARHLPSAVIATTPLSADADSDEPIKDLVLNTLADGMVVVSGTLPPSTGPASPVRPSLFVVADPNQHTYRTFRVRGAVEDDARVKKHLKERHGIDWNAQPVPPRRPAVAPIQPVAPLRLAAQHPRRPHGPQLRFVSLAANTTTCLVIGDVMLETLDIRGHGVTLAQSRSFAGIITDYNPEWRLGEQRWSQYFNTQNPLHPTKLFTNWYVLSTGSDGYATGMLNPAEPLAALAVQNTTYYNDDFLKGMFGRTRAFHHILVAADRSGIPFASGNASHDGLVAGLIATNIHNNSYSYCYTED